MSTKKTVQANYSNEMIVAIVAEYKSLIVYNKGDNKQVLSILSEKYGKTVPSLRAKLASLKVYQSADKTDKPSASVPSKITKEQIANSIAKIVGQPLDGLEAAPKNALLAIVEKLLQQNDKISDLVNEMLAENEPAICESENEPAICESENEPAICDDLNDND